MEGFEMSRLNYRLAETLRKAAEPFFFFREGRNPKMICEKNFRISFKGSKNKNCFGPIEMRKVKFIIWTNEAEKLLEQVQNQLSLTLKANILRFLNGQLGKKRPLLKFQGFIDLHNLRMKCSIGKKSFAITQMQF